jgi:membrane-bound metal-dependent hydrolase YbcI (DUF457 family)
MDPITHGITGALLGKSYFSDRYGRVATFAAVLGAVFPDIDIAAEIISRDPLGIVKYHRGITHSFVALPFFAMFLAWLTKWITRRRGIESPSWGILTIVYGAGIASHIALDGMTSFGTRMWTPISQKRVAWDLLFIIDFAFTAIVLLPQVAAWIYSSDAGSGAGSDGRAGRMWILFSITSVVVWGVALGAGYSFHWWIVGIVSGILAALFFLPGMGGWGFRVSRSAWCQLGTCAAVAYLLLCAFAHHSAMLRVHNFATANHIDVLRIGALPVPPSLLDWGDVIQTPEGVYQARFDLRHAENPSFYFLPDSPSDPFVARALRLPEVEMYWGFARFPTIHSSVEDGDHVVDFGEHRFTNGGRRSPQPFSYRVIFDQSGAVIAEGWLQNGMFMQLMKRMQPAPGGHPEQVTP